MTETSPTTEQEMKVIKAVVIDDAFDDIYASEIPIEDYRAFCSEANGETDAFDKVLEALNIDRPALNDWNDDSVDYENHLRVLWERHDDPELRKFVYHTSVFQRRIDNLDELKRLCSNLKEKNFEIKEQKSFIEDWTIFNSNEYVYVFLDYNLGVQEGKEAVANAQRIAKQIYDACPKGSKPITILMSSDSRDETLIEKFQEDAGWVEGVFRFSQKKDLSNPEKVSLLIRAYQEEFISNGKLQSYLDTLINAAKEAQDQFGVEVKKLKVEDYEYIYSSILRDSQQPLGDYLKWLYGAHWQNLMFKNTELIAIQDTLDQIISDKKPLHHTTPSKNLSKIFMTALYEQDFDTLAHKWYLNDETLPDAPHLHLGDLFTSTGSKNVHMIINPQCDLERPSKMDKEMSIFVIPGTLDEIENQISNDKLKTEFFIFEEKQYRIYWNIERVKTIEYKDFIDWVKKDQLNREHRLRLPFALEVQRRFTSNLSRVGLPVSPPLYGSLSIRVGYKSWDGKINRDFLPAKDNYGFMQIKNLSRYDKDDEEKDKYRLTLQFALDFKEALIEEIKNLRPQEHDTEIDPKQKSLLEELEKFNLKFDDWFFTNRAFKKPKPGDDFTIVENKKLSSGYSTVDVKKLKTYFWIEIVNTEIVKKDTMIDNLPESKCTS
ncbi:hypothetical protein FO440_22435 [Mucilaginibacter corticis]|uniref:Response receiver domain-containing protein n=1 Tax=Mucilaginibacter corticis TaxID=2597670 RepID=A0A556M9N3_9SPHI|nr:hypothetical protein [Mucilaginibacter corticis]TSJ36588.1 hypothetical protein FO440_22435 [Mucilaginibacter corticis]